MKELRVLVLGKLVPSALSILKEAGGEDCVLEHPRETAVDEAEMEKLLNGRFAVISEPLDKISSQLMDKCSTLRVVSNRAVGFDNVDLAEATSRGILVSNTPGVLDNATADLAFTLLLACARRIVEADRYVRDGHWQGYNSDLLLGPDLWGKTLGVIGMGRIGTAFAMRARAFGLKVIYTRSGGRDSDASTLDEKDESIKKMTDGVKVSLDELLERSDFISIHCPLSDSTRKLIGERELAKMKPDCILVNTSRGPVVDQEALVRCLQDGKIRGAGLDVFENEPHVPEELKKMDNVVLAPHIGSACIDTRRIMSEMAAQSIVDAFNQKKPAQLLNPEAWDEFVQRFAATGCSTAKSNSNG